jgi:hypothetical protein
VLWLPVALLSSSSRIRWPCQICYIPLYNLCFILRCASIINLRHDDRTNFDQNLFLNWKPYWQKVKTESFTQTKKDLIRKKPSELNFWPQNNFDYIFFWTTEKIRPNALTNKKCLQKKPTKFCSTQYKFWQTKLLNNIIFGPKQFFDPNIFFDWKKNYENFFGGQTKSWWWNNLFTVKQNVGGRKQDTQMDSLTNKQIFETEII